MKQQIEIREDNFSLEEDLVYLKSRMKYVLQVLEEEKLRGFEEESS